jgi:ribonuclease BN (tRNA processing enzyme)
MRVTFLGAGDAFGSGGQNHSGYLVEASGGKVFLFDCGPTTLIALKRLGLDPAKIDFVAISHLHGDHFSGLSFLFLEYQYENRRTRPLTVAGPPRTEQRVRSVYRGMYRELSQCPLPFPLRFQEMTPGKTHEVEGVEIFAFQVPHQIEEVSLALRATVGGKTVFYSGDTGWTEDLVRYSEGADLAILECSFFETEVGFHLSYPQIRRSRHRFRCKRLVLSHLGREVLARAAEVTEELAHDGLVVEV